MADVTIETIETPTVNANIVSYEDICKANALIKTTPIHGKDYAEVAQRIKAFRCCYPMGTISTILERLNETMCLFRAEVRTETGALLGTGTAYELYGSSNINKTSFIENCETSAVGRALAMCGFGIEGAVASLDEVQNAQNAQAEVKPKAKAESKPKAETKAKTEPKAETDGPKVAEDASLQDLRTTLESLGLEEKLVGSFFGKTSLDDFTEKMRASLISGINSGELQEKYAERFPAA